MKKLIFIFILSISLGSALSQVIPSDCTVPGILVSEYEWDVKNLALRRMFALNSQDTALITIPVAWQDTIMEGMAAILNLFADLPEADSVFNLYCVHDRATAQYTITESIILMVDTSFAWTDAWQNLVPLTGNPEIDALMTNYSLVVESFDNYSFGSMAVLASTSLWNTYALINQFEAVEGVNYGEPNSIFGAAGRIIYTKTPTVRFYDFQFQWNDCFDGCDNIHTWKFSVNEDCGVDYLGFTNWGAFGIEPLPSPINCNFYNSVPEKPQTGIVLYPNPTEDILYLSSLSELDLFFQIADLQGRKIMESHFKSRHSINVSGIPVGMYILWVIDKQGNAKPHRFIKN